MRTADPVSPEAASTLFALYEAKLGLTDECHIMDALNAAGLWTEDGVFEEIVRLTKGEVTVAAPLTTPGHPLTTSRWTSMPAPRHTPKPAVKPAEVTFAKRDDTWMLRGPHELLAEGAEVTVTKRDGTTKIETVGVVYDTEGPGGTALANIAKTAANPKATPAAPTVPAGYYATTSRTGNNDLDFWAVDVPAEGKWAGYTFVSRVIGGHEDTRVRGAEARAALEAIQADGPFYAAQTYGRNIGRCGRCNRHLTDETSRALGLGPDCAAKAW
jgi:hypothetical protein